jgi:hypothetical protein
MRDRFARTRGQRGVNADRQRRVVDAVTDPYALAGLDTLHYAEGEAWRDVRGGLPWNALFNSYPNRRLEFDMGSHPGAVGGNYRGVPQSAAGHYQIERPLFDEIAPSVGVTNSDPVSQNAVALGTMDRHRNMLANLRAGRLQQFVKDASRYWASLPQGPLVEGKRDEGRYGQRAMTYDDFLAQWKKALVKNEGGDPRGRVIDRPVAYRR